MVQQSNITIAESSLLLPFQASKKRIYLESRLQSFKQRKGFKSVKDVFEYILESEHEP